MCAEGSRKTVQQTADMFRDLLDNLTDHLRYLAETGVEFLEMSPQAVKNMRLSASSSPRASARREIPATSDHSRTIGTLDGIAKQIASCRKCSLHAGRTRVVPGQGSNHPEVMFIGEAPGQEEDQQGLAFVGAAGQLLTKMIAAMGYSRENVFIANVVKCRPPANRKPMPDEMETCLPYLREQIRLLKPNVIVALGATAVVGLLKVDTGITKLRGNWMSFEGIPVMPTYHPAYLLRCPAAKSEVWKDLRQVLKRLGRVPPVQEKKTRTRQIT